MMLSKILSKNLIILLWMQMRVLIQKNYIMINVYEKYFKYNPKDYKTF